MEQLEKFQSQMKIYNMDAYIIPTGDFHNSEYVDNTKFIMLDMFRNGKYDVYDIPFEK